MICGRRSCGLPGKAHLDVEAAFWPGVRGESGAVDDGEAEAVSADMADSLRAEWLERLEEAVHLVGGDQRSGVTDRYDRQSVGYCRRDLDPATVSVVPYGVINQIRHQAFYQARVTRGRGRGQDRFDADAPALGFLA